MPLDTPLTDIQEVVERSVFHSIRQQCVAKGYTPNVFDFPKTNEGFLGYLQALEFIKNDVGFAIEVFNTGAPADRLSKQLPRIVVATQGYLPGAIGGDLSHVYELGAGDKYTKYNVPPTTSDLYLNIHIVSNNTQQHRILGALMALSVPRRGYIRTWDSEIDDWGEGYLFCNHLSYVPVRQYNSPGTMETIYRYVLPDLFETNMRVNEIEISPLKEINLQLGNTNLNIE